MKKMLFLLGGLLAASSTVVYADDYIDDIYYNPSKDNSKKVKNSKPSYYISDFGSMDVDEYNRRGQYYSSPIDTIGTYAESGEDFVYTQKIQKFYNPTIVVENIDVLESVLANSYGNVDIVYNVNGPAFSSVYSWNTVPAWWYSPYYYSNTWGWGLGWNSPYWSNMYWSVNFGPVWANSWAWTPSWAYGPSWTWGPSWGWGPAWSYGPGWGWGAYPPPSRPYASYTPGRNRPLHNGWDNRYHGYNYNGGHAGIRPGSSASRPGSSRPAVGTSRPSSGGLQTVGRPATSRPGSSVGNFGNTNRGVTVVPNTGTRPGRGTGTNSSTTVARPSHQTNSSTTVTRPSHQTNSSTTVTRPSHQTNNSSVSTPSRPSNNTSVSRPSSSPSRGSSGSRPSGGSSRGGGGRGGRR